MHTGIAKLSITVAPLRDAIRVRIPEFSVAARAAAVDIEPPAAAAKRRLAPWRHPGAAGGGGAPRRARPRPVWFLPGGFVGVDVFFVLSGFLITSLLLVEARTNGSVSLVKFYLRRARRLLPAAALTLLVTDIAAFFLVNFLRAGEAVTTACMRPRSPPTFASRRTRSTTSPRRSRSRRCCTTGRSRSRSSSTSCGRCCFRSRSLASSSGGGPWEQTPARTTAAGCRRRARGSLARLVGLRHGNAAGGRLLLAVHARLGARHGRGARSLRRKRRARASARQSRHGMGRDRGDRLRGGRVLRKHAVPGLRGARPTRSAPPS